jgi:hypothetical protein
MRYILRVTFVLTIISSIFLVVIGVCNREWETVTASVSLIIAIISAWIAHEIFIKQSDTERPQIILRLDFKSRYGLILLVAENFGQKPAFNIKIMWDKELMNLNDEVITFNKYDSIFDIPVLNTKEQTSIYIDTSDQFFEKHKEDELDYSGIISFQESLNSKKRTKYPFYLSFKHYGLTPYFENELPKTLYELQKIPEKLDKIEEALKKNKPK